MSALTENVPAAQLQQGDFITLPSARGEVLATVRRVTAAVASDRVLVDYYLLAGDLGQDNTGSVDFGPCDLVRRVPEREARPA